MQRVLSAQSIPIIPNALGIRVSCNKSFADAMLRMNGSRGNFDVPPDGFDGNLSIIWKYSSEAQVRLLSFVSSDRIGVHMDEPSFGGIYASRELNRLHNLQWIYDLRPLASEGKPLHEQVRYGTAIRKSAPEAFRCYVQGSL